MLYCLVSPLVSSTNQIYRLAATRLVYKLDLLTTLTELLDNITQLVMVISKIYSEYMLCLLIEVCHRHLLF